MENRDFNAEYVTGIGRRPAKADDTVEFYFDKRGEVWFRASQRFCEAALRAKRQQFETVGMADFFVLK